MKTKSVDEKNCSLLKNIQVDLQRAMYLNLGDSSSAGSAQGAAILRQSVRANKRLRGKADSKRLAQVAIDNFVDVNSQALRLPDLTLVDAEIMGDAREFIHFAMERFFRDYTNSLNCVASPQCTFDLGAIFSLWRFGPGASNGIPGVTHFADKIDMPMSCTSACLPYVRLLRKFVPCLNQFDRTRPGSSGTTLCVGSLLGTVPKNSDTNRTICIEPSGNMALQLAAGMCAEGALRKVGINIQTQEGVNKQLAYEGSKTGLLSTVDLKNASDLIRPVLIKALWPTDFYNFLLDIRSNVVDINGELHIMAMMSTMGNGYTFPVMTLTLFALCYGISRKHGGKRLSMDTSRWGVYGDDIIVPTEHFDELCHVLTACGLVVNYDKSYADGSFRESCGGDYYAGYDVTPFYVESIKKNAEVYVAINKVLDWSIYHDVSMKNTLNYLYTLLQGEAFRVPEWEDPSSGIQTRHVEEKYKKLVPKKVARKRPIRNAADLLSLLGGYVSSTKDGSMTYVPRRETTYVVERSVLPRGRVDGSYPLCVDDDHSKLRAFIVDALIV